jgi:GNAT superfamily N-acetyltransferase
MSLDELDRARPQESDLRAAVVLHDYLIAFERFIPFGFVGAETIDDCCRLVGPYLYRDYLGRGYGKFLLQAAISRAHTEGALVLYSLGQRDAAWFTRFLLRSGFEAISDNPEDIRRWRDGLLAGRSLPVGTTLFARLIEEPPPPPAGLV